MLILSTIYTLLSSVLTAPTGGLHTAVLFTPSGQLVGVATEPVRSKEDIKILVGIGAEVWREARGDGFGRVESELGRLIIVPVDAEDELRHPYSETRHPLMLLALNATDNVGWEELKSKSRILATALARPLNRFREFLVITQPIGTPEPSSPTEAMEYRERPF